MARQAIASYVGPASGLMDFITAPSLETFNRAFTPQEPKHIFHCRECGKVMWEDMDPSTMEEAILDEREGFCVCSDCIIRDAKFDAAIEADHDRQDQKQAAKENAFEEDPRD